VSHRTVEANGRRFHVAEAGDPAAPPLVLVHGWPQHWWIWRLVIPELARSHRLLCPDLPGLGWSEPPGHGYGKEALASDVLAVLDALEIERAGWIGHDWGAFCGQLAALRHPDRLTGLMILSVPHLWPSRADRLNPRRPASLLYQIPLAMPLIGPRMMRAGGARLVLRRARRIGRYTEDELETYDAPMRSPAGQHATTGLYRTFLRRELAPLMAGRYGDAHLRVPALLMMGTRDPIAAGARLDGQAANAPDLRVEWVPGAGHFLPEEAPELIVERARELFAGT